MRDKAPLILVGGGGHCLAAMDVIAAGDKFFAAGIVERSGCEAGEWAGIEIVGTDDDLERLAKGYDSFAITIGQMGRSGRRRELFEQLAGRGARLATIVSPLARVALSARLGAGTIVMHRAIVNAGAEIGSNCIINTHALVEHGTAVGDHCHLATGAIVNGDCEVGEDVFVGSGAIICNGVRIADGAIIGAGCVVVESIEEAGTYVGLPARRVGVG